MPFRPFRLRCASRFRFQFRDLPLRPRDSRLRGVAPPSSPGDEPTVASRLTTLSFHGLGSPSRSFRSTSGSRAGRRCVERPHESEDIRGVIRRAPFRTRRVPARRPDLLLAEGPGVTPRGSSEEPPRRHRVQTPSRFRRTTPAGKHRHRPRAAGTSYRAATTPRGGAHRVARYGRNPSSGSPGSGGCRSSRARPKPGCGAPFLDRSRGTGQCRTSLSRAEVPRHLSCIGPPVAR